MITTTILNIIILILILILIMFVFRIMIRTNKELKKVMVFIFSAAIIFGLTFILEILSENGIISSIGYLFKILYIIFFVLLIIAFYKMLYCIKIADGELSMNGKLKIKNKLKKRKR